MADEKRGFLKTIFNRQQQVEPESGPLEPGREKIEALPKKGDEAITGKGPYPMYVRINGPVDLDGLYRFMAHWLKDRRFEFHETMYKFKPPELHIIWLAERRKSGFIMEIIHIVIHMFGEYDIDILQNGKKRKMSKGRMTIEFNMEVKAPYEDMFGKKRWNDPIQRRLLALFHNYVLKREIEIMTMDMLYYELHRFQADVKEYLNLSTKGHVF